MEKVYINKSPFNGLSPLQIYEKEYITITSFKSQLNREQRNLIEKNLEEKTEKIKNRKCVKIKDLCTYIIENGSFKDDIENENAVHILKKLIAKEKNTIQKSRSNQLFFFVGVHLVFFLVWGMMYLLSTYA